MGAMTEIFQSLYPRLCYFAQKFVQDKDVAEDLVQDAFANYLGKRDYPQDLEQAKALLYVFVRNACINYIKRVQVRDQYSKVIPHDQFTEDPKAITHLMQSEVAALIRSAIAQLPPQCQRIFELSYYQEKSNQEIADIMELSLQTVKNQKARGYMLLRKILADRFSWVLWVLMDLS
jgi:RNA polymerase sigma-70 factor (family 1)